MLIDVGLRKQHIRCVNVEEICLATERAQRWAVSTERAALDCMDLEGCIDREVCVRLQPLHGVHIYNFSFPMLFRIDSTLI